MEFFDNNFPKRTLLNAYPNNIFNQSTKNKTQSNPSHYLIPDTKLNMKSSKVNNQIFHEITYKNNDHHIKENPKMIKFLTEYYSYPLKNLKSSKSKNSTMNQNNYLLQKEYQINSKFKKDYDEYSPEKRYTFNYKENKAPIRNIIESNSNQINMYNTNNKYLLNQSKKNDNINQYEKILLLNKLNNSRSANNYYGEDILIEYNNFPTLNKNRNLSKKYLNDYLNKSKDYLVNNSNMNNINNTNYKDINNNSNIETNNNINNIFDIDNNDINENNIKDIFGKSYGDINLYNVEENYNDINSNDKYEFFGNDKKWKFNRHKNYHNITMAEISNKIYQDNNDYLFKDSFENYQNNNNIFDINNNINNINIFKSNPNNDIYKLKQTNTDLYKYKKKIKKNINNYKIININKSIYFNNRNNEAEKNNNLENKKQLNYINKSKKDIFKNKDLTNIIKLGNQKIKKRISPEPKNNVYNVNINNPKAYKKFNNNNNVIFHEIFDTNLINNKRNINIKNNIYKNNLLTEKNIDNKKLYEYIIRDNQDKSYKNYETNENYNINNKIKKKDKIVNITNYQSMKNNCKYLEIKNNTSRYKDSKFEVRNIILTSENVPNNRFTNIDGYKSSKELSNNKEVNKNMNMTQKMKSSISPIFIANEIANDSTHNSQKNIKNENVILSENINNYNNEIKNIRDNLNTEANTQYINKNLNKKETIINKNKILNANSFSILKNISINNNNLPIKLYLKKNQMKNKKNTTQQNNYSKENNKGKVEKNINYTIKQIKTIYNNKSNINNNLINSKIKKEQILINNMIEKENVLNNNKNKINICYDQNNKSDVFKKNKYIKFENICTKEKNEVTETNGKSNIKTLGNEIFDKNKQFKILKFISPKLNRNINKSNSNMMSFASYMQTSTYDIKNNDNNGSIIKTECNSKSNKNIFYKGNISENNRKIKQKILNNSTQYFMNDNYLNKDYKIKNTTDKISSNFFRDKVASKTNNLKNHNNNENNIGEKSLKNKRNYRISKNNINLNKLIRSPTVETNLNLNNCNDKRKIPKTPNLTQINSFEIKSNDNKSGVYIKPFPSKSKSKPKNNKTKSVLKMYKNNNSERNINKKKIIKRIYSNLDYYSKTSPLFFQKDEYFQSEFGSIKRGSTSLNTSHITKNENSSLKTKENELSMINNSTIINFIRESYKKDYFFAHKIYNYFIKTPTVTNCYFIKKNINKKQNNKLISDNDGMNNLRMTFRNVNQKNDNTDYLLNENKDEIDNNEHFIYHDIEESDLDIYKELHKKMQTNQEQNSGKENFYQPKKEILIYETIQKLKTLKKDYNKIKNNQSTEKEISKEINSSTENKNFNKNLKYEKLQSGLIILDNLTKKKGIKNKEESLNNFLSSDNKNTKNEKIFLGSNGLNELFNNKSDNTINNKNANAYTIDYKKSKGKNKVSKSVNKDIIKGISKIENVFGKNNTNIIINTSNDDKKIGNLDNVFEYNQEQRQKVRTYVPKKRRELYLTKDEKSDININLEENQLNEYNKEYKKEKKYKDNIIFLKDVKTEDHLVNHNPKKSVIKYNDYMNMKLNNSDFANNYKETISYSDEDHIKLSKNNSDNNISFQKSKRSNSNNSEDFDNYLKLIEKDKINNIINQDLTFLLNIISKGNYYSVLKQITQIILYEIIKSTDKNISSSKTLKNNKDIIYNEHLLINKIFKQIAKGIKYVCVYSQLCFDLNQNILNELKEQKNMKNNKERNLKIILNDKCIQIINDFKKEEDIILNNKDNFYIYDFKGKVLGFVNFIYELINVEILKQQFGFYVLEQLYKLFDNKKIGSKNNQLIINIYLEGIIVLTTKLGKFALEKENQKLQQNINDYIDKYLIPLIDVKNNQNDIQINLKYRILNIISKKENQWTHTLYEIYKEEDKIKIIPEIKSILSNNLVSKEQINTIYNSKGQNINEINKNLIEEDIINYISYFSEENNKGKINIKTYVDKSYNWKVIDELVNNKNFGLESIINYFISICSSFSYDDNKLFLCNDYIKNIIEFYANSLSKIALESLQNEIIKTFSNVDKIVEKNKDMYKILGNLLLVLIDNKLFHIKFFNHYLKCEKKAQINLAIITKYCIISSGKFAKKYLNDFKQTKLFNNNDIFEKYVIEDMKDLLYFIK